MRIIDADALIVLLHEWEKDYEGNGTDSGKSIAIGFRGGIALAEHAPTIKTKEIKYYDDDENVWKIGRVIVDE